MNETFRCGNSVGDGAELVAYLYDDCEPGQREAIAAHLAQCAVCTAELESLRATRQHLAAWTPPDVALGFRITRSEASGGNDAPIPFTPRSSPSEAARSARWWRQPLPAWAQVAAAAVIFASGMALGVARNDGRRPLATVAFSATSPQANAPGAAAPPGSPGIAPVSARPQPMSVAAATARDLEDLERRLRGEVEGLKGRLAVARTASRTTAAGDDEQAALLRRVEALIRDSEERQRKELGVRVAAAASQLDTKRQIDFAEVQGSMGQMQRSMGQLQTLTAAEARDQREAVNYLLRVSQRR